MARQSGQTGDGKARTRQGESNRARESEHPHPAEWLLGGVSALLVATTMGFIFYQGLVEQNPQPGLTVEVGAIEATGEGFRVTVRTINRGDRTAAGVTVERQLEKDGRQVEASEVQFDYVPAHSERKGALLFSRDPRQLELTIRAEGYRDP